MQGGFNTLDNFLFTIQDFLNPNQSILFNRLYKLNSVDLNFYLDKLKRFCIGEYWVISKPVLVGQENARSTDLSIERNWGFPNIDNNQSIGITFSNTKFRIITDKGLATVLTSTLQRLGSTPLELDKREFEGKTILVSNGKETKRIVLNSQQNLINIEFE